MLFGLEIFRNVSFREGASLSPFLGAGASGSFRFQALQICFVDSLRQFLREHIENLVIVNLRVAFFVFADEIGSSRVSRNQQRQLVSSRGSGEAHTAPRGPRWIRSGQPSAFKPSPIFVR
jgi:hypothetical protein